MIKDYNFSTKRVRRVMSMMFGMIILSVLLAVKNSFTIDRILSLILLQGLFFPIFVMFLNVERTSGRLNRNLASSYRMLTKMFLLQLLCYFGFSFLPAYFAPVMIPAIFLTATSNASIGMVSGLYLDVLLCMVSECSYNELAAYLILTVLGCLLAEMLVDRKYRIYINILILALSLAIPGLFYFLSNFEANYYILLYGVICGLLCNVLVLLFFDRLNQSAETEVYRSLKEIVNPDFSLVRDIRNYSQIDYMHAVNVSRIAYQCALQIGADPDITAAAGFYYRLGKLEGEPFVENGVALAKNNCFPVAVVQILAEYNGEQEIMSTRESAIVHMVDAVLTKFALLDKDTLSSTWNRDIVIYQTLNEKSASGVYDESGLSMNQYLKIREYLTKGGDLF